jgi:hypothetical protein
MLEMKYVQESISRLYAELAELKRYVVKYAPTDAERSSPAWQDLMESSAKISAGWSGPGAVQEIRDQREK